ncbi:MAG: caspase family protein [Pseudomonadota bacterium]
MTRTVKSTRVGAPNTGAQKTGAQGTHALSARTSPIGLGRVPKRLYALSLLACVFALNFWVATAHAASHALLIGINEYPQEGISRLEGPVEDAKAMQRILSTRLAFAPENINMLLDDAATKANILAAIAELADQAGADDEVYIHFAGHGSQIEDYNNDEEDGFDETLLAYDSRTEEVLDIVDDELAVALRKFNTDNLVVVLDSCHSGTATRASSIRSRWSKPHQNKARYRDLPAPPTEANMRHVLLTGAAAHQLALEKEIDGVPRGLFSHAWGKAITKLGRGATYGDLKDQVLDNLKFIGDNYSVQNIPTPQLEPVRASTMTFLQGSGNADASPNMGSRFAFAPVRRLSDERAVLKDAALLGAQIGSVWGIYPAGTMTFADDEILGRVTVDRIEGDDAVVRSNDTSLDLDHDQRAIPFSAPTQAQTISMLLTGNDDNRINKLKSKLIEIAGDQIQFFSDKDKAFAKHFVESTDGVTKLFDATGMTELKSINKTDVGEVAEFLLQEAIRTNKADIIASLVNPTSTLSLDLKVVTARSRGAKLTDSHELPSYFIKRDTDPRSSKNSLQVMVETDADAYITLVDIDAEGNVITLFPNSMSERHGYYPQGRVLANQQLYIPDNLEMGNEAGFLIDYTLPTGVDTIVAFASTDADTTKRFRRTIAAIENGSQVLESLSTGIAGLAENLGQTRGMKLTPSGPAGGNAGESAGPAWTSAVIEIEIKDADLHEGTQHGS